MIVSDADGPRQFCRDGDDCLMVPREDVGALAHAVRRLMEDKVLRMTLVKNGYKRYREEFTKEKSVGAYIEFYLDILKQENLI